MSAILIRYFGGNLEKIFQFHYLNVSRGQNVPPVCYEEQVSPIPKKGLRETMSDGQETWHSQSERQSSRMWQTMSKNMQV
jgi:hypothetical protein